MSTLLFPCLLGALCALNDPLPPLRFTIATRAETRSGCVLTALAEDKTLRVEQAGTPLTLSHLVEIRQETQALPPLPTQDFVLLSNGDRIPLDPNASATLTTNRLLVWPARSLPELHEKGLSLYLPYVVLLFWSVPEGVDDADLFFARLRDEPRKRDVIHFRNGDRMEGTVTALGSKVGCVMTVEGKQVQTPWSKLAGIAWNTDRQARLRTKQMYYRAVLQGGTRVNFNALRFDGKSQRWTGTTQFGTTLDVPAANVLALDVRQGAAVDLADLAPSQYEHRPYLGVSWPMAKDTSVTGHPLRLANSTYEKGLGLHAPCQVTYKLNGQYERFESMVGLDDVRAPRGRARLSILLDSKRIELHDGKEMTNRDPPLHVRLDVRKVKEMTLVVEQGSFGDVQAHVNWANARLIKSEK